MTKWSDKYKKSIDCSNPKGFSQKAHCAGRKKKMNEAGRPYSKTYLKLLMKAGQGKTADTVNVKIPKSGHFMDEENLNEKGVFTTLGRVAGQYVGNKIGADMAGASAGEAMGVHADYHTQKAARTAKARFKKFRRGVERKGYKVGDATRAALNKPRKPAPERKEPTLNKEACWDSHKQVGFKMKKGRRVPNCVPKNEDAPVNAVGGGNIAGLGVGPQGEPGIPRKRKKLTPFILFMKRKKNV